MNRITKDQDLHVNPDSGNAVLVAGLLSKGDVIVSKRTGKELLCYTEPHNVWLGNTIVNIEYYLWDSVKKKSKRYKGREIKAMLESVWSVKPCH